MNWYNIRENNTETFNYIPCYNYKNIIIKNVIDLRGYEEELFEDSELTPDIGLHLKEKEWHKFFLG